MSSKLSLKNSLYLIILIGFSISLGGWIIYQGGIFHQLLGGAIALGSIIALIGIAAFFFRRARRKINSGN